MDKNELKALAERVMALAGPCEKTDAAILYDVLGVMQNHKGPAFTASLDAAMTLVPEGAWWWVEAQPLTHGKFVAGCGNERVSAGATPALALTAAALLALAEQVPE